MRVKWVRDDLECTLPALAAEGATELRMVVRNGRKTPVLFWKRGSEVEHPKAFYHVLNGIAIPADQECAERCGMTEMQMKEAQRRYHLRELRIPVECWPLYDAGYISGWRFVSDGDPEGEPIPGPKWAEYEKLRAQQEEEEDDE